MRKLLAVATVLLAAGCNFKNHTFPGTDPRWASVDYQILAAGMLFTLVMGRLGGLMPALSAMRMEILDSLR